tara:strand:- start:389 stop:532 length:144 start_codon:yes stop_codon:yes gene_type:complete
MYKEKSFWQKADELEQSIRELASMIGWAIVVLGIYIWLGGVIIQEIF